jgi:hypothetical protein
LPDGKSPDRLISMHYVQEFEVAAFASLHALYSITPYALYEACLYHLVDLKENLKHLETSPQKDSLVDGVVPAQWVEQRILGGYPRLCLVKI